MASNWMDQLVEIMDTNVTSNRNIDEKMTALTKLKNDLYLYYLPLIVIVGILANVMCCIFLLKSDMRRKFFTHLYIAVYIADTGFLITLLLIWVKNQGVDIYSQPGLCQMTIFMGYFFPFLSMWHSCLAAALLLLRVRSNCIAKFTNGSGKAKIVIAILTILSLTSYLYKTWTSGLVRYGDRQLCNILPEVDEFIIRILNVMDLLFIMVLPFIIFLVFDITVLVKYLSIGCNSERMRHSCISGDAFVVIFAHSVCFQLFVAPECISKLLLIIQDYFGNQVYSQGDRITQDVLNYSFYTYFAIKPMIHTGTSHTLRYHIKQFCFGFRRKVAISKPIVPHILTEQTSV